MEKVIKKYALQNSYFKNKREFDPDTLSQIIQYTNELGELPFEYNGNNWAYDTVLERQKKKGIVHSQYLTPDVIAKQVAELTNNFHPANLKVLDACCGTGQLTKFLLDAKLHVEGFDIDPDMVEVCKYQHPDSHFYQFNYKERLNEDSPRWNLIVSNPPFEQKELLYFLEWLSMSLTNEGKAVLLMPLGFFDKTSTKMQNEMLSRFTKLHQEPVAESFAKTTAKTEIIIVELSEKQRINSVEKISQIVKLSDTVTENGKGDKPDDIEKLHYINLQQIEPNPYNPRKKIDRNEIEELARNIKEIGLLQPVILRPKGKGFEIVCGERRYSAFKLNEEATVPAFVREYTDDEVMEIALSENLQRENLSPIEEAIAFQQFIKTGKYTIEDLKLKLGKSESYIKCRLQLNNLSDDFQILLENKSISIGSAIELSKYSTEIQKDIFNTHFPENDSTSWQYLPAKELTSRIERFYTSRLDAFDFDKAECHICAHNTEKYTLFKQMGGGKCTNLTCLKRKREEHTLGYCLSQLEKYPDMEICVSPYEKINSTIGTPLSDKGVEVKSLVTQVYPVQPPKPLREGFASEEEFIRAQDEYQADMYEYYADTQDIDDKISTGEYKMCINISSNDPKLSYTVVQCAPTGEGKGNPILLLEKQDKKNKETFIENILKDAVTLIKNNKLYTAGFTDLEEKLLFYSMLDLLSPGQFQFLGIDNKKEKILTDEEKFRIYNNATPEQISFVKRNFLIKNLAETSGLSKKSLLFLEFVKSHFSLQLEEIKNKHTETYKNKHQNIQLKITKITEKSKEVPV